MASPSDFFTRLAVAGGSVLNGNELEERLLSASLELAVDRDTELSFAIRDPNYEYLRSFGEKGPLEKDAEYESLVLRVAGYSTDGGPDGSGQTTLKMRPRGVQRSRKITGALTRENISASQYAIDGAAHAGMKCVAQPSTSRPSISRDIKEAGTNSAKDEQEASDWSTIKRLAGEEAFLAFESMNTLYFATPQWLFDNRTGYTFGYRDLSIPREFQMMDAPELVFTTLQKDSDTITFRLPLQAKGKILPGNTAKFSGVPFIKDKLLITSVSYPLAGDGLVEVSARKPWIVEKVEDKKINVDSFQFNGGQGNGNYSGIAVGPRGQGADFYAREIIAAAKERNLGKDGARNGIATALVETNLKMYANRAVPASLNYPHDAVGSDHDSVGLFQQRQAGWGTLDQRMNARASAGLFFNAMMKFDWRAMDPGAACQRVQRSAYPSRYSQRMGEAMTYVNRLY